MRILGIESSCDETAAAIVEDGRKILSNVIASQASEHQKYGGVVPELASRRHLENILTVVKEALSDADMELEENILPHHILEAVGYRSFDLMG